MNRFLLTISLTAILISTCSCSVSGSGDGGDPSGDKHIQPVVTTSDVVSVTAYTAQLKGSFSNSLQIPRETGFEWGVSSDNLSNTLQSIDTFTERNGTFRAALQDLSGDTRYYFRAYILVWENGKGVYHYGEIKSFATSEEPDKPGPGPSTESNQPGWFELPVMNIKEDGEYLVNSGNSDQYYAWHMCAGGEKGPDGKTARNFTVCVSKKNHCPLWVAAPRHSMYVGNSGRNESYRVDDQIPSGAQYTANVIGGSCNRGHMLGSAERTSSVATNRQVFLFSNIAPQLSSGFNQSGGGWNNLEDWVDGQVCSDTLYVVIGCYFDQFTDGYGNSVSPKTISYGGWDDTGFPTMFYYVLLRTKSGNSGKSLADCSSSEMKCAAFVRSHTGDLKGQKVSRKEMMSVSDLEKITGFTYFANLPNLEKDNLNPSDWGL